MDFYFQLLITGLLIGAHYGIIGLGLSFTFQVTGMLNLAYGSLVMVAGLLYADLTRDGMPVVTAALAAILVAAALSTLLALALRPWFTHAKHLIGVILTLIVGIMLAIAASMYFGKDPLRAEPVLDLSTQTLSGAVLSGPRLVVAVASVGITAAFAIWYRRSRLGTTFRALVDDEYGAEVVGLNLSGLRVGAFTVAGLLAGFSGVLIASAIPIDFLSSFTLLITGLTASVVGGLANPVGALAGGLLVGSLEGLSTDLGGSLAQEMVAVGVLIVVLALRPEGLLAARHRARAV